MEGSPSCAVQSFYTCQACQASCEVPARWSCAVYSNRLYFLPFAGPACEPEFLAIVADVRLGGRLLDYVGLA